MRIRLAVPLAALLLTLLVPAAAPAQDATVSPAGSPAGYLQGAANGRVRSRAWWDPKRHWYRERLDSRGKYPLATLWGVVPLFEATNALAIADPGPSRRAAVRAFAQGAERYWNPHLRPVPGYAPYPGNRSPRDRTWYDDNGWWGIAFYDAYRATGDTRYLGSAKRAMTFVDSGWDSRNGGLWWDTKHSHKAGESLAAGTLLAASLYNATHSPHYLAMARKYITWADSDFRGDDGLYDRHEGDHTPMPYVQGPMFAAFALLCEGSGDQAYCQEAEELAAASTRRFPKLTMGPQYDAMYVRALLELYRHDRNPRWYSIAEQTADRAMANGRAANGLFLNNWDGGSMRALQTKLGMLQTHAATTSVMAWMAAAGPP